MTWGFCSSFAAETKVEEQVVGLVLQDVKYVVSPHGGRVATVARKGSRMVVTVDGVEGTKVDEVPSTPELDMTKAQQMARQTGHTWEPQPVAFSRDGNRYAYVARVGREWVLVADGKEVVRVPAVDARDQRRPDAGTSIG